VSSARQPRVLIVDDSSIIRTVVVAMLEHLGAASDVATNGSDAIAAAQRTRYDLVLMDLHMPGLDSSSATRMILDQAAPAERPRVVGVTGAADKATIDKCLRAGMSAVLIKPLKFPDLAPLIEAAGGGETLTKTVVADLRALDGGALLGRLAASFRESAARRLEELRAGVASGDHAAVRAVAHALRGVAGTLGARRAQMLAGQLEAAALNGELMEERRLLGELATELPVVQAALDGVTRAGR
jgi:CheY-like chemotaxis protein